MTAGKIIVLSAPSGAGKTTIARKLVERGLPLHFSVSATSRAPRKNEVDGKDYHFLSLTTFQKKIETGDFLEWEEVYPNTYYGTLKSETKQLLSKGKTILCDVDVVGGLQIKALFPQQTLTLFISPPSLEDLANRLRRRATESKEKVEMRLNKSAKEMTYKERFDRIIINKDISQALSETEEAIKEFMNKKAISNE